MKWEEIYLAVNWFHYYLKYLLMHEMNEGGILRSGISNEVLLNECKAL